MKIDLVNQENSTVKSINISDSVFKTEVNHGLIHELVTSYRSNGRSATKAQKNRSRVSGGGAKPWRKLTKLSLILGGDRFNKEIP